MRLNTRELSDASVHYYVSSLPAARKLLYYPVSAGYFDCTEQYEVYRKNFDSFLLILMLSGSLAYQSERGSGVATPGNALLLDCYAPHAYRAREACSFLFLHFDGGQSRAICEAIFAKAGCLLSVANAEFITDWLGELLNRLGEGKRLPEAELSLRIYETLMRLLNATGAAGRGMTESQVTDSAIEFVLTHLGEPLSVEAIADHVGYSPTYFTRIFRAETGMSPYQFVIKCRAERAQQLLHTSRDTIQEIAMKTGFGSAANFCYAFRRFTGMSPLAYRRLPL